MSRKNNLKIVTWLAKRYLFRTAFGSRSRAGSSREYAGIKLSRRYFPLLAFVSAIGVALGVMSLIVVLSVMEGFKKEVSIRLQGLSAHVTMDEVKGHELPEKEAIEKVLGSEKYKLQKVLKGEVIVRSFVSRKPLAVGAEVRGVKNLPDVKSIEIYIPEFSKWPDGAVIGEEMMNSLAIFPDFGDRIELVAPMAEIGPTGDLVPRRIKVNLSGFFESGVYRYDSALVFLPIEVAKKLLGYQARSSWEFRLDSSGDSSRVAGLLKNNFKDTKVSTWSELNKRLFAALRLERWAMTAILFLTILISSFSISGATSMFVSARRKDAAILQVCGLNKRSVSRIFLFQGATIGIIGSFIGTVSGLTICYFLSKWHLNLPEVYYLDYLPVKVNPIAVVLFVGLGLLLALLSAWFPVRSTLKESAISVLRYE